MKIVISRISSMLVSRLMLISFCLLGFAGTLFADDNSITSSLNDMLVETRVNKGPILTYHEVLSISGTLPMLGVGCFYHYPSEQNPIDALGISLGRSFNLTGESVAKPTTNDLIAVRNSLLESQQMMVEATSLALQRTILERQLASLSGRTNLAVLQPKLDRVESELKTAKANLLNALTQFRTNASKPGIVVANWSQDSAKKGGFSVAPILSGGGSKSGRRKGIVILGGIRVSQLFIGNDFKSIFLNLTTADSRFFGDLGITTYLLQAKNVMSVNEVDLERALNASVNLKAEYFTGAGGAAILKDIESIQIEYESAFASQLNNLSSIGDMKWQKEEVSFELKDSRQSLTNLEPKLQNGDWRTVHAVVTLGKKVFREWSSIQKDRPAPIIPELASFETVPSLTPAAKTELLSLQTNIAHLNAHLETDRAYLLNDRLYEALKELAAVGSHLNAHLSAKQPKWETVKTIADRENYALKTILQQLGTNSWSDIERLGAKELEIMKAINYAKPLVKQFPKQK
jgi:hypothetical protein